LKTQILEGTPYELMMEWTRPQPVSPLQPHILIGSLK
jgi:hypothetical protein